MKNLIKIVCVFSLAVFAYAGYGFYGDAFIVAAKSAQSGAMGGTGLTSLDGIASVVSNPAGLVGFRQKEVFTQYRSLFGLASQNSIGISMPYGKYQVGAMLNVVGVQLYRRDDILTQIPNINERREYVRDFLATDKFYDLESALLLSAAGEEAIEIKPGWSFDRFTIYLQYGANVKFIYKALDGHSALGAGVDAGIRFLIPGNEVFYIKKLGTIALGLNMENIVQSPVIWFDKLRDYGNMRINGGLALHQPIEALKSEVRLVLDGVIFESRFFPDYGVRYGLQWRVKDFLDIRLGKDLSAVTGGVGLLLPVLQGKMRVDYSIQYHEIHWSHLITLSYYWGGE
ncbi:MAG: hypothetical protein WC372_02110 [Candidatus Neomarinimicrobiota bacterium]|jgi:hypothetical protein|nr:hypothetical protein [Candidatus Neomarinimicrobiota bacterium]MDD3965784.1 hypothetical protein [Candidatus Neomarinimicrobiota bacterium]MDX9780255.1 hypothetical protein [bacterium]